ncbi:MAG TPA: thiamine biosynthesis protein ApbE [Betaproteobacteria bacterium]|nr:thiamine biosynthesis protein ApbE [Betaproteobacteria bacterium]
MLKRKPFMAAGGKGLPILFVLALGFSGCSRETPIYHQQGFVFGTMVEVTIAGVPKARAQKLAGHVLSDFDIMTHTLNAWKPGTLSRMNAIFALSPSKAAIAPGMIPILRDATRYSTQSGGLFNPSIGKLIQLWGFESDTITPRRPDPAQIAALVKANPQMTDIVIDGIQFYSKNPAVRVDLGGYAKGYALDIAAAYLRAQGVKNALINIGGNIIALGRHGDRPWEVGIQDPRKPGPIATLALHDGEAIGTSGDYQHYFIIDGVRYCHIIDPRTGYPAQGVQSVTVLTPPGPRAGVLSDVASKPPFIAGVQGWRAAARKMGVDQVMLIDDHGQIYLTAAMKKRLHFLEKGRAIHVVP